MTEEEDLKIRKFSVSVAGRKTSISLEGPFRRRLHVIAVAGNRTVSDLVTAIKRQFPRHSLSGACRLYVLQDALGGSMP